MTGQLTEAARERIRQILADPSSYATGSADPGAFDRMARAMAILESLPMLVYDIYADGEAANETTMLVGNVEAVVGVDADTVLADLPTNYLDPRDLPEVREDIANASPNGTFETAFRSVHRDRGSVWTFAVGTSSDGLSHRGVIIQSDQFERLKSELEHKTRLLEAVSQSLPGGIFQVHMGLDGRLTCPFCSPAIESIVGWSAEAIMANPDLLTSFVVEEDRELLTQTNLESARDLTPWELSYRVRTADGGVKVLWCGGIPERQPDGSTLWTSLTVDITEVARRSREADARTRAFFESEKLESLGRLAGGMAHDINNLLVGVLGNAEMLRETTLPLHVTEIAEEIVLAASGCADLTRQILAFSGRGKVQSEVIDLRRLVTETARLARPAGSGPEVHLDIGEQELVVRGDPTQLRQVLLNLVTNALQASPREPVEVRTRVVDRENAHASLQRGERFVQIAIEDRGDGILPAHHGRVFEPYFTTRPEGRGLGLASALGIVRNHDGVLTFDSIPGAGTTFEVWLPLVEGVTALPEEAPGTSPSLAGMLVLVVDDQPEVMTMALRMLRSRGAVARGLTDPHEVLGDLASQPCDLLLLDLTMPELPGTELFVQVRERHPDLPVVFYSGYSEQSLQELGPADRVAYLQKPFAPSQLVDAVQRALGAPEN